MASTSATDVRERPTKRLREGDVSGEDRVAEKTVVNQSTAFWFEDGNVAIIANGSVAFRVHRGVLVRHSPVFRDMFKVPQPPGEELLQGCPVMHVSDSPEDFTRFLAALYDCAKIFRHGERLPFHIVASIVALAHKYQVDHIVAEGVSRMKTCFSHRFSEMQSTARFSYIGKPGRNREFGLSSSALQILPSRDAIRAVNLVRLLDETSMLPVALYLCTLLSVETLLAGSRWPNGSHETLCRTDLALCLEGRTRLLVRAYKRYERLWSQGVSEMCSSTYRCAAALRARSLVQQQQQAIELIPAVFESLEQHIRSAQADGLCGECAKTIRSRQMEEIRCIWEKLPGDLGLEVPEWDATPPAQP